MPRRDWRWPGEALVSRRTDGQTDRRWQVRWTVKKKKVFQGGKLFYNKKQTRNENNKKHWYDYWLSCSHVVISERATIWSLCYMMIVSKIHWFCHGTNSTSKLTVEFININCELRGHFWTCRCCWLLIEKIREIIFKECFINEQYPVHAGAEV